MRDGLDIHARNHTVAYAKVGEIERVLENADFVFGFVLGIVIIVVEQILQIAAVETHFRTFIGAPASEKPQDTVRQQRRKTRYRVEQQVKEIDYGGENAVIEVRIAPHDGFGDELGDEDYDDRRDDCLEQYRTMFIYFRPAAHKGYAAQEYRHA